MSGAPSINLGDAGAEVVSLPERFEQLASEQPQAIAIRAEAGTLTWHELCDRVHAYARALADHGIRRGERVAILAENCLEYLPCFMGIVTGGYCAVTLPTLLRAPALATLLHDCGARVVFITSATADLALEAARETSAELVFVSLQGEVNSAQSLQRWLGTTTTSERPVAEIHLPSEFNIVYSSGTTGSPKGIVHSHRTRAVLARGLCHLGFGPASVTLISTPLYTNLSLPAYFATLWGGGSVLIMEKFEPGALLELAERQRASHFFLVPIQLKRLLEHESFARADLRATQLKFVAGSHLGAELKREALERWPGALLELYGLTEGAPVAAFVVGEHRNKIGSVGRPVPGTELLIIDDDGRELATGGVGEIVGRSSAMMLGYNQQPGATEALVWHHPDGRRFFRSGDLGKLDEDGFLYIVGRKKDMIISGGLNIYASDIEEVLEMHPAVAECAVIAMPSERWGETPWAVIVRREGSTVSGGQILAWCNERLAKYQRLSGFELCAALPRNALGKVEKRMLRETYRRKS